MFTIKRDTHNPLLSPRNERDFEAAGAFNWSPAIEGDTTYVVYRAQGDPMFHEGIRMSLSTIAIAESIDGTHFLNREQYIKPEEEWDKFGCEDPRVTRIGDTNYIFYTGLSEYPFGPNGIRIAMVKADKNMKIVEKHPVTPFNAKAMGLFPKKINGKFAALLTPNTDLPPSDICYVEFTKESDMWSPEFWNTWYADLASHVVPLRRGDNDHVELGAPPIYTSKGWLVIYSHIQNYRGGGTPTFGIEFVLLDLKNPQKIIGRTKGSVFAPEEHYEKVGHVGNIVFPSGALVRGKILEIYYGAADTHCCIARANLNKVVDALLRKEELFTRSSHNPILAPRDGVAFEAHGAINPAVVDIDGTMHILYRAISNDNVSTVGYATSKDGLTIDEWFKEPIYLPRADFEKPGGCEDPRTVIVDDKIIMMYTAFDGSNARVAVTSITVKDFLKKKWDWEMPIKLTIPGVFDKDGGMIPKKFNGKYFVFHRIDDNICGDFVDSLDWKDESINTCIPLLHPRQGMWDGAKVGIAGPPIETKEGWLLLYHGVSPTRHYRVGAILLDLKDPTKVLARTATPLFEPKESYELEGAMSGVVFPCGVVARGKTMFIYYGAADLVTGAATADIKTILDTLSL